MSRTDETFQIIRCAIVFVDAIEILRPISVISAIMIGELVSIAKLALGTLQTY
jgi:hypothetical protein